MLWLPFYSCPAILMVCLTSMSPNFVRAKKSSGRNKRCSRGLESKITLAEEGGLKRLISKSWVEEAWDAAQFDSALVRVSEELSIDGRNYTSSYLIATSNMKRSVPFSDKGTDKKKRKKNSAMMMYEGLYIDGSPERKFIVMCPLHGGKRAMCEITEDENNIPKRMLSPVISSVTEQGKNSTDNVSRREQFCLSVQGRGCRFLFAPGPPCCDGLNCLFIPRTGSRLCIFEGAGESPDCFSPLSTVFVEGKGRIAMSKLSAGDRVLTQTENTSFETVYDFGDYSHTKPALFLQIYTSGGEAPLEITPDHLVFVQGSKVPVAAAEIQVGDRLVGTSLSPPRVKKIDFVVRTGFYAPFTTDGTIVVDGIKTSCYVSQSSEHNSHLTVAGISTVSWHFISHMWLAPRRLMCLHMSMKFCQPSKEEDQDVYYEGWTKAGDNLAQFYDNQNIIIQGVVFMVLIPLIVLLYAIEQLFDILVPVMTFAGFMTFLYFFVMDMHQKKVFEKPFVSFSTSDVLAKKDLKKVL